MPALLNTLALQKHNVVNGPSCLAGTNHAQTFALLARSAPPPTDRAGWMSVCRGAHQCLRSAADLVTKLSEPAEALLVEFSELARKLDEFSSPYLAESTLPMWRRLARHPQWSALANAAHRSDPGVDAALGVELFSALIRQSLMAAESTRSLSRVEPDTLSKSLLLELLAAPRSDLIDAPIWAKRLIRLWPELSLSLDGTQGNAFEQLESAADRFRKTLVGRYVYASPKHRGGILDHRHIDLPQVIEIGQRIGRNMRDGDGRAAVAMLAWLSAMTPDSIARIPLASHRTHDWVMCIDLDRGLLCTDISCVAKDLALPITDGHLPASNHVNKPLPQILFQFLQRRFSDAPAAECIGQLLPELRSMKPHEPVVATAREIVPSLARWTNSAGVAMKHLGMDNLLAALTSNDFSAAPKSKLYYTCVGPDELWSASTYLFEKMQWGPPTSMPSNLLPAGSRVVPTDAHLTKVFSAMRWRVDEARPAKRSTVEALFEFHNRYCAVVAWIVSFACASRHVSELEWTRAMLTSSTGLLFIEDKQVSDLEGGLPIPLGRFVGLQIDLYLQHLRATHRRLSGHAPSGSSETLKWMATVLEGRDVPLFKKTCGWRKTRGIGSASVLVELPEDCQVAPDVGRKFWEPRLRELGITTSKIDGMLRHEVTGQERFSCASDFILTSAQKHIAPFLDNELYRLFGAPIPGLRGAALREKNNV